jgi:hypothetical protein
MSADYENLKASFAHAKRVCDPIEFEYRQKNLLYVVTRYLLERDRPEEEDDEDEE